MSDRITTPVPDPSAEGELDTEGLLSPQQAADHLRCSLRHIRREIASGALPVVRLTSRLVRIRPRTLARYIAERQS